MNLPSPLLETLAGQQKLEIRRVRPVSGGSINQAAKLHTNKGELFVKWNESADPDMFGKESRGLRLLRNAETDLTIPKVLAYNDQKGDPPGFLLMEFLTPAERNDLDDNQSSARFGEQLALLHQHTDKKFGLDHDNYIGRLPQSNQPHSSWVEFFIHERIGPQIKRATDRQVLDSTLLTHWENLAAHLKDIFPDSDPALLHGDLWSGNYFFDSNGKAVLVDPAVYYGHPEMELSFTRMFGGFSGSFYDSYNSVNPFEPGFAERVPIYNLYPLLVHANLFGGHYATEVQSILKRY